MEKMLQEKKFSSKINYDILKNLTDGKASDIVSKIGNVSSASPALSAEMEDSTLVKEPQAYLSEVIDETPTASSSVRYVIVLICMNKYLISSQ